MLQVKNVCDYLMQLHVEFVDVVEERKLLNVQVKRLDDVDHHDDDDEQEEFFHNHHPAYAMQNTIHLSNLSVKDEFCTCLTSILLLPWPYRANKYSNDFH